MIELRTLGTIELRATDGRSLQSVIAQPKRFAVLAYLAIAQAPGSFHRRDALVAMFWPELDAEHARAALRNAIYFLRQSLGSEVIRRRGDEELGIDPAFLSCDVIRFEATGSLDEYGGPLLPGFHITDAAEFDEWLEMRRRELARHASDIAWSLVDVPNLKRDEVVRRAQRAVQLSELNDSTLRKLLLAYERAGDRAGATRAFEDFRRRMCSELELEPSDEMVTLLDRVSARTTTLPESAPPIADVLEERVHGQRKKRWIPAVVTAALVTTIAVAALFARRSDPEPILAVTTIHNLTGIDSVQYARSLPELLATSLARAPRVQVISSARLYELTAGLDHADTTALLARAAKRAGATEHIEGAIYRLADGQLRLDVRRVDSNTGNVRASHSVTGRDVFAVVDNASDLIIPGSTTQTSIADVTTSSTLAWQLYVRGLRANYLHNDRDAAIMYFKGALEEDSAFAMAAYYIGLLAPDFRYARRAAQLAGRTTDRERLQILANWAYMQNDPAQVAYADTLATRYPSLPESHFLLGRTRGLSGDFTGALAALQRAVTIDSAGLNGNRNNCVACDALGDIAHAYIMMDSMDAAVRTMQMLVRRRPDLLAAREGLSNTYEASGRFDDALRIRPTTGVYGGFAEIYPAVIAIHKGDFASADELLGVRMRSPNQHTRNEARWYHVISLRNQGRLHEALKLSSDSTVIDPLVRGIVLFEAGRYREAAALWERLAGRVDQEAKPHFHVRDSVWRVTHAAAAFAAAGDTARVKALADVIEKLGPRSAYGRDQKLFHHLRGLVLAARGDHIAAIREYRAGLFSPTGGYIRGNLEIGRSALALRRFDEAIAALQPAFRNAGLQSVSLYATRTELHELLGHAWYAKGQRDSAATHYRYVVKAWRTADPLFHARRDTVQKRLADI